MEQKDFEKWLDTLSETQLKKLILLCVSTVQPFRGIDNRLYDSIMSPGTAIRDAREQY